MPKRKSSIGCSFIQIITLQSSFIPEPRYSIKQLALLSGPLFVFIIVNSLILETTGKPIILQQDQKANLQSSYFKKLSSQQLKQRTNTTVKFNDGTKAGEFYNIDDMLFVKNTTKRDNRAGQYRDSYRWPNARVPFTFAPGYCK